MTRYFGNTVFVSSVFSDFLQWGQLSRPYSSTDRSSSLGSMESLDTPTPTTHPYSDSCNSPMDPTVFTNKRDSAYSSFSASSNTSDYAMVPLRPDEACSMDNLLQSLGPSCQGYSGASTLGGSSTDGAQLLMQKSRSLTRPRPRPVQVKERPSSCCYDNELKGGDFELLRNGESGVERKRNAPQPPTRKDSFRATRSRPDVAGKRCVSAPVEISSVSFYDDGNKPPLNAECGIHNGFSGPGDKDRTQKASSSLQSQTNNSFDKDCHPEAPLVHFPDQETASTAHLLSPCPALSPPDSLLEEQGPQLDTKRSKVKRASAGLHRHSAPEKLLATQLQLLQFASDGPSLEPHSQANANEGCGHSMLQTAADDQGASHAHLLANKWEGSRSSTPGSVFLEADEDISSEKMGGLSVNGSCDPPVEHQHSWQRSVSVPGDTVDTAAQGRLSSEPIAERDFEPLSTAASMDTLLEEQKAARREKSKGEKEEGEANFRRSSRSHLRNRRRSERFATNLRNEIQRKKAQLQRSRGPGGLLCSGETVQEEEGPELNEEEADPDPGSQPVQVWNAKVKLTSAAAPTDSSSVSVQSNQPQRATRPETTGRSRSVQILDPGLPTFGFGIRVVEEPAPAGKARRWRWTPEHKLQPEPEPEQRYGLATNKVMGVTGSRHGVCAFTSSSYGRSSSCSRMEEADILPFADRMKFFEETSKGVSANQGQRKPQRQPELQAGDPGQQHLTQRRYSFQGGVQQESPLLPIPVEVKRLPVSTGRERQGEKEREHLREREERMREMERQEMEAEKERTRLREMQLEREREEKLRRWEEEREREMERAREAEHVRIEREKELERERKNWRDEGARRDSCLDFYGNPGIPERTFHNRDTLHTLQHHSQAFYHDQTQNGAARSAFHPVTAPLQSPESQQSPPQGYTARSCTPTEVRPLPSGVFRLLHPN